jgi:hypothetical protein
MSLYLIAIVIVFFAVMLWLVFDLKKNIHGGDEREKMAAIQETLRYMVQENRELRKEIDSKL